MGGAASGVSNLPLPDSVRSQLQELVAKLSQLVDVLQQQAPVPGGGPAAGHSCESSQQGGATQQGGTTQHGGAAQQGGVTQQGGGPAAGSAGTAGDSSQLAALALQAQQTIARAHAALGGGAGGGADARNADNTSRGAGGTPLAPNYGGLLQGGPRAGAFDPAAGEHTGGGNAISFERRNDTQRQQALAEVGLAANAVAT